VMALWPTRDMLDDIDGRPDVKAVAVLTWNLKEVLAWASGMNATNVLGDDGPPPAGLDDEMTRGALRVITDSVNLSTGISHTSDYNHALLTLRELRDHGRLPDPDAITAWCVANGWRHRHGRHLAQLASELQAGKAKRLQRDGMSKLGPKAYEIWAEQGADANWEPA